MDTVEVERILTEIEGFLGEADQRMHAADGVRFPGDDEEAARLAEEVEERILVVDDAVPRFEEDSSVPMCETRLRLIDAKARLANLKDEVAVPAPAPAAPQGMGMR